MEGTASRIGRVSRYGSISGPGPSAPVFSGPVRKWKRKWVRSQPNDNAVTGGRGNHPHHPHENKPSLLLCRWTRLPATNNSDDSTEPAKRKFRYTPVVVLEEKKKEAVRNIKAEADARKLQSRPLTTTDAMLPEKPGLGQADDFKEETKEASDYQAYFENLDLQL